MEFMTFATNTNTVLSGHQNPIVFLKVLFIENIYLENQDILDLGNVC